MSGITIDEFDALVPTVPGFSDTEGLRGVPPAVFNWLELQCLRTAEHGEVAWLRLTQRRGRRSVQVTNFVGVMTGTGINRAPSLLFPMEAVFEAFVAKHLARQLAQPFTLKTQTRSFSLVRHQEQNWFRLKPDLLVRESVSDKLVLDTKWKLIDGTKANGTDKYGLAQADFYQLHTYGHSYLDGAGDVVLIYPKTDAFSKPLDVFDFPKARGLRLWVLPFCLRERTLVIPQGAFAANFNRATTVAAPDREFEPPKLPASALT